jgi:hypothetical protein
MSWLALVQLLVRLYLYQYFPIYNHFTYYMAIPLALVN